MPFHLLLGSSSGYLPALAYASDRHVTDLISVMSCQSRDMSAMCLSCSHIFRLRIRGISSCGQ